VQHVQSCVVKIISVIPAQAGIHKPLDKTYALWIPACAGMTV
jgi:hypothetical protein